MVLCMLGIPNTIRKIRIMILGFLEDIMWRKHSGKIMCSGTLKSYILSYGSVVLVALAVLSIIVARQSAIRMRNETLRVTEAKLYSMIEDLDNQFKDMRVMAMEFAGRQEFSTEYVLTNKYNELEMLNQLKKRYSFNGIADRFFLKYAGYENVFTSGGTTLPVGLELKQCLTEEEQERLTFLIEEMCEGREDPFLVYKQKRGRTFLLYSLNNIGKTKGVLCFEVSEESLKKRLEKAVGTLNGTIAVYYDGNLIYGEHPVEISMVRESEDGRIYVEFEPFEEGLFSVERLFSAKEWLFFIILIVILLCFATLAAWRSYRPIKAIVEKYNKTLGKQETMALELESIDLLVEELLKKDEKNTRLLAEQYQTLREQTIRIIAAGGYEQQMSERLPMLNLKLNYQVFCSIRCELLTGKKEEGFREKLCKDVEELSGDGIRMYAYWEEKNIFGVLTGADEDYQIEESIERLSDLFEVMEIQVRILERNVSHDLRQIRERVKGENKEDECTLEFEETDTQEKKVQVQLIKNRTAEKAIKYIEANCTKYDLSLDMVAEEFSITPTYLCRLIKQETGKSYKEYLTQLRMIWAKEFLQGGATVAEACQKTGYTNVSYFIRVFQKAEGITPARYRNEFRKEE